MDNKKLIGMRLNSALAKKGIKQKELAQQIGVTDNTISYFCSGRRTPNIEMLISIARALNVSGDYLLGLSDVITPSTDLQAVVAYTGLSEDNVATLNTHKVAAAFDPPLVYNEARNIQGDELFLDCANDLLDAMYENLDTLLGNYYLVRSLAASITQYDPEYYDETRERDLLSHGHTTMPTVKAVQLSCIEFGGAIERYLRSKYVDTDCNKTTASAQECD